MFDPRIPKVVAACRAIAADGCFPNPHRPGEPLNERSFVEEIYRFAARRFVAGKTFRQIGEELARAGIDRRVATIVFLQTDLIELRKRVEARLARTAGRSPAPAGDAA